MYVNIINLMGARLTVDSEAEYRLMVLGKEIVKARKSIIDISLALKDAYASSLLGDNAAHDVRLREGVRLCSQSKIAWASVKREATECARWLKGNVRPEYANAFTKIARSGAFREKLASFGASDHYMAWAFDSIHAATQEESEREEDNVISCFTSMAAHSDSIILATDSFYNHLNGLMSEDGFLLFKHIFDQLALKAEKPELYVLDEKCFLAVNRFEILYEAIEQITREAHTLVPGTHNQIYKNFDLRFTEPPQI